MRTGWKTTEFWLSLAAAVVGVLASYGVIPEGSAWETVLAALGYTVSRTIVKMRR